MRADNRGTFVGVDPVDDSGDSLVEDSIASGFERGDKGANSSLKVLLDLGFVLSVGDPAFNRANQHGAGITSNSSELGSNGLGFGGSFSAKFNLDTNLSRGFVLLEVLDDFRETVLDELVALDVKKNIYLTTWLMPGIMAQTLSIWATISASV